MLEASEVVEEEEHSAEKEVRIEVTMTASDVEDTTLIDEEALMVTDVEAMMVSDVEDTRREKEKKMMATSNPEEAIVVAIEEEEATEQEVVTVKRVAEEAEGTSATTVEVTWISATTTRLEPFRRTSSSRVSKLQ